MTRRILIRRGTLVLPDRRMLVDGECADWRVG